jgi:hypothetical protein
VELPAGLTWHAVPQPGLRAEAEREPLLAPLAERLPHADSP